MNTVSFIFLVILILIILSSLVCSYLAFTEIYFIKDLIDKIIAFFTGTCGNCTSEQYCGGVPIQCRDKEPAGAACVTDSYCQSGKCVQGVLKCGDANGKLPNGTFCDVGANQCLPNSWCGGVPVQCRSKGGNGDYCPLSNEACQSGYYCGSDSKCQPLGRGGDYCVDSSHCQSGNCSYNNHLAYYICTWPTSGKQTYNSLNPPNTGTCVGSSGTFDSNYEAAKQGQSICEKTPNFQFSGEVSGQYQYAAGGTKNNCRSGSSVPICVKID